MNLKQRRVGLLLGAFAAALLSYWSEDAPTLEVDVPSPADVATLTVTHTFNPLLAAAPVQTDRTVLGAPTWRRDQVLVKPAGDLASLAARHGVDVLRPVGASGYGALSVPEGLAAQAFLETLAVDADVHAAGPQGITYGAGGSAGDYQWHLDAGDFDEIYSADLSDYVVAVLDSGVAYEDHQDASGAYVRAPSLASVEIVTPWDFVNGDSHANDDHQHGTHIASLIVSDGEVQGGAPGAALMPLKVLDHQNSGVELDLVDAIHHAVDNHADVINMSLTFGEGYAPSPALEEAIDRAHSAGVVLVGAVGNDSLDSVGWPAASPQVIAVGSGCLASRDDEDMVAAPYSNLGRRVDLLAPGGCLDRDKNRDGYPDGMLAETISLGDPTQVGYWLYAGTSQAAAVTSAAVLHMLEAGTEPHEIRLHLQRGSDNYPHQGAPPFLGNVGAGALDIEDALESHYYDSDRFSDAAYHVGVMPFLVDNGDGTVTPSALLSTLDEDMKFAKDVTVYGRIRGSSDSDFDCVPGESSGDDSSDDDSSDDSDDGKGYHAKQGSCVVSGEPVSATSAGVAQALAWQVTVDGVTRSDYSWRPGRLLFANDELEDLANGMLSEPALDGVALGIHWNAGPIDDLAIAAEAYVVLSSGTGVTTSPMGLLITPPVLGENGGVKDMDGSGITTSPLGLRLLTFGGSGITTSPLGLRLQVLTFDGTGVSTSPFLGMKTLNYDAAQDNDCRGDCDFRGEPITLADGLIDEEHVSGTALQEALDAGGWLVLTGQDGAAALAGMGVVEIVSFAVGSGAGLGAVQFEE